MSTKNTTWRVEGMLCPHCEETVRQAVKGLPGIKNVTASYRKGTLTADWEERQLPERRIAAALKEEGYTLACREERFDKRAVLNFIISAAVLVALWLLLNNTGLSDKFSAFPVAKAGMSLSALFIIGLMTSLHCAAMCGGISIGTAAGGKSANAALEYNAGRVVSYTVTGGIVGALGRAFSISPVVKGIIQLIAGAFMIIMALNLIGYFSFLRALAPRFPKGLRKIFTKKGKGSPLIIGLLNGLMPCGPLQAMQIYALSSGSWYMGALSMLCFALGTLPLMLGVGLISGKLNKKYARHVQVFSAMLVAVLGIGMVQSGAALADPVKETVNVGIEAGIGETEQADDIQEIYSQADYGSYEGITVKAGIPVKWHLNVPEGKLNGCNNAIIIPQYGIEKELQEGDNIIEFTPKEAGNVPFSCWMGMIRSEIKIL